MARKVRGKNRDNARRSKKKVSILTQEKVDYVDYKDVNLLRRFMSDRAKIRARRVTGNDSQQQREVAAAIKNAREMALLPYTNRVTQTRSGGGGRDRSDRGPAGAPPVPSAPPPSATRDEAGDEGELGAPEAADPSETQPVEPVEPVEPAEAAEGSE
jgi:small subunit ribosomal protein S18